MMDPPYVAAFAALAGSAIGGLTSLTSAWHTQNRQQRASQLSRDKATRQALYKQFIDEASKLYADALVHDETGILALSSLYALIIGCAFYRAPRLLKRRRRSRA